MTMSEGSMNRRNFMRKAAAAAAFPYVAAPPVRGANDRIQVGFAGVGGRAQWLMQHEDFAPGPGLRVAQDRLRPPS
jgi:hypothetical protein